MGSSIGTLFRLTTWGESHGGSVGGVIEGCPPGIVLDFDGVAQEVDRRRTGSTLGSSPRKEADDVEWLSGIFEGITLGTPIAFQVRNKDIKKAPYRYFANLYRPSHADYTYDARYGVRAWAGGGRASARETVSRVIAGAIARQVLAQCCDVDVLAWVSSLGGVESAEPYEKAVTREAVEQSAVRCPDPVATQKMEACIVATRSQGDSLGGVIKAVARNLPPGLGDPVFDKLEADLAKAMLSIPSVKGFEVGSGFAGSAMRGQDHNDPFVVDDLGHIQTLTNHSGGIQGGISNGMPVEIRIAFKPVSTIFKPQKTVDTTGKESIINPKGRHDTVVVPRATAIVEAMMCLVLADHLLRWRGQVGAPPSLPFSPLGLENE